MTSISISELQHTPDITHTSTKLAKLITVLPVLYYFPNVILVGLSLNAACDTISDFYNVDEKIQLKDQQKK